MTRWISNAVSYRYILRRPINRVPLIKEYIYLTHTIVHQEDSNYSIYLTIIQPKMMFHMISNSIILQRSSPMLVTDIVGRTILCRVPSILPKMHISTSMSQCRYYTGVVGAKVTKFPLGQVNQKPAHSIVMRNSVVGSSLQQHSRLSSTSEDPFMRRTSNVNEDDIPPITLTNAIRMKNAALGTVLFGCCLGIMWYSMHAVGQAGATTSSGEEDPLAVLKMEAAAAQSKYDKEQQQTANTAEMLQKFQKGEYDPDHVPDEDIEADSSRIKKPWWKIW
jgi:hypothetical protein